MLANKDTARKFSWNLSFLRACQFLPELCKNIFFRTAIAFPVMVSFLYIEHLHITGPPYIITSWSSSASSGKALSAPSVTKNSELWTTCCLEGKVRRENSVTRNLLGYRKVRRAETKTRWLFRTGGGSGAQQVWILSLRS